MDQTFGNKLRALRLERKMTLRIFASLIGVTPITLSALENDDGKAPDHKVLERICEVCTVDQNDREELYQLAENFNPVLMTNIPSSTEKDDNVVHIALRVAKGIDQTDDAWKEFMQKIEQNKEDSEC